MEYIVECYKKGIGLYYLIDTIHYSDINEAIRTYNDSIAADFDKVLLIAYTRNLKEIGNGVITKRLPKTIIAYHIAK